MVALVAAYNEADVIGQVIGDLAAQGVSSYLLDHGSTDGTAAEARRWLGKGLVALESLPDGGRFSLDAILRRKEELAASLDADWFLNHDADELREGPWSELDLAATITLVDRMGYNAVDFEVLDFVPTTDDFRPGDDLRQAFPFCVRGAAFNRVQVRCWKKTAAPVRLEAGGHDVTFPGRRVFPLRFLLRHYPIRSQAHGERKVFGERLPRFDAEERERGWHRQYEGVRPGHRFLADPAKLERYDPDVVRARLAIDHRGVEELRQELSQSLEAIATARAESAAELAAEGVARGRIEADLATSRATLAVCEVSRGEQGRRLEDVFASWSWRLTAPLRWLGARLRGSGDGTR